LAGARHFYVAKDEDGLVLECDQSGGVSDAEAHSMVKGCVRVRDSGHYDSVEFGHFLSPLSDSEKRCWMTRPDSRGCGGTRSVCRLSLRFLPFWMMARDGSCGKSGGWRSCGFVAVIRRTDLLVDQIFVQRLEVQRILR
jgi:hypothetical protein